MDEGPDGGGLSCRAPGPARGSARAPSRRQRQQPQTLIRTPESGAFPGPLGCGQPVLMAPTTRCGPALASAVTGSAWGPSPARPPSVIRVAKPSRRRSEARSECRPWLSQCGLRGRRRVKTDPPSARAGLSVRPVVIVDEVGCIRSRREAANRMFMVVSRARTRLAAGHQQRSRSRAGARCSATTSSRRRDGRPTRRPGRDLRPRRSLATASATATSPEPRRPPTERRAARRLALRARLRAARREARQGRHSSTGARASRFGDLTLRGAHPPMPAVAAAKSHSAEAQRRRSHGDSQPPALRRRSRRPSGGRRRRAAPLPTARSQPVGAGWCRTMPNRSGSASPSSRGTKKYSAPAGSTVTSSRASSPRTVRPCGTSLGSAA
ncbi:hypothetical protein DSM104329_03582 [Capillimicrobium parvum]|uniref:Uncharacterized protein n=1 Tax=Capillimicrobium parvum TaxID=2884022 RepID=A0A9E7C216_9ACTN|nr:hypothetical protein DSM104329_03582 [Capillimicrobium parvum]